MFHLFLPRVCWVQARFEKNPRTRETLIDSSPRRKLGSSVLVFLDSGVRRNDGSVFNRRLPGKRLLNWRRGLLLLALPWCFAPAAGAEDGVRETCQKIGRKLSSVSAQECLERGLSLSADRSVNGVPLLVKEYRPGAGQRPQARIMLIGGTHGDEYSSVSVVFKWMKILDAHHSGLFHWQVIPLLNPDGLLSKPSRRTNSNGVDLNRNFATDDWEKESLAYWVKSTKQDPRRYPGKTALSEPESRWLAREIDRFRPNVIVSVHAPYNLLDFDGPPNASPKRLGSIYLSLLGTFPGSMGRYAGVMKNIPVITIELPNAQSLPSNREMHNIWADLVYWLRIHVRDRTLTADAAEQKTKTF